jgi:hypothetical protein
MGIWMMGMGDSFRCLRIYLPDQALSSIILLDFFPALEHYVGMRKKNQHAVALSRLGAKKGGLARARSLSPERRQEIARKAAYARWDKARA